jgi:hypothetical protein
MLPAAKEGKRILALGAAMKAEFMLLVADKQ